MMYNDKLVAAIKHNGEILREFKDSVYLSFGSEYSIYLKNLNSVRALATVTVDGINVGDGTQFVVNPNNYINIKRFIKNGNLHEGNSLKFIERTEQIENHKGIGVEDGLVRVEFQFEKIVPTFVYPIPNKIYDKYRKEQYPLVKPWPAPHDIMYTTNTKDLHEVETYCSSTKGISANNVISQNEAGITVPGSISDQEFSSVLGFPVEAEKHVIVLKLVGKTKENEKIRKPITVKKKIECSTCGTKNKTSAKFCSNCGTCLVLL